MSDEASGTNKSLWHSLVAAFEELEPETKEEEDEELRAFGLDPDQVGERLEKVAERALRKSPYNWRNRSGEIEEAKRRRESVDIADLSRDDMLQTLRDNPRMGAHFRDFEELTDEDLRSLLADQKFLEDEDDD